jgi:hypothetical protein
LGLFSDFLSAFRQLPAYYELVGPEPNAIIEPALGGTGK